MTLLQEIIEGASGDTVPVSTLLRKVKVLASRIASVSLEEWVDHELTGYPPSADIPEYRGPFHAEVIGTLGGSFGSGIKNAPIPSIGFPADFRGGVLFNIVFEQPIAELERLAAGERPLRAEWPADAIALTNTLIMQGQVHLYEGMGVLQAHRVVSPMQIAGIIDTVRTRILNLALSLEGLVPTAGEASGPQVTDERVQQVITNNIYGGAANIAVASAHFQQNAALPAKGDRPALFDALRAEGIDEDAVRELEAAMDEDERAGDGAPGVGIGPRVKNWVGQAALTSGKGALAAGAGMAVKAIAAHYGVG